MATYKEWENFCNYLIHQNRYALDDKGKKISEEIIYLAQEREIIFEKGKELWKGRITEGLRIDNGKPVVNHYTDEGMKAPSPIQAKDGRANPAGISYLYLSENIETAIAETKPHLGAIIDLASFELKKDIKIVDIRKNTPSLLELFQSTPEVEKKNIDFLWFGIKVIFAVPLAPEDKLGYIPTQYVAGLLENVGYEGLIFESVQRRNNINLVLFDPLNAELKKRTERRIELIEYVDNNNYFQNIQRKRGS